MRQFASIALLLTMAATASSQIDQRVMFLLAEGDSYAHDRALVSRWCPSITGDARDMVGANDGSLIGGTTVGSMGFLFNGSSYVLVGDRANLSITNGAFTITAWVYNPNSVNFPPISGFVSKGKGGVDAEYVSYFNELYGSDLSCYINGYPNYYVGKNSYGVVSGWNFATFRWDGNAKASTNVFCSVNSTEGGGPLGSTFTVSPANLGGKFCIGALNNGESYFMGAGAYIDDIRFFGRLLTTNELAQLRMETQR